MQKLLFILSILVPALVIADTRKIPITADVGICAHRREVHLNTGGNSHIRIKGNEHYYLFNFDIKPIRNWKITKATLHLKLARGHLRKVAFCTVPSEWVEGTAVNKPQKGSTCFTHLKYPDKPWTRWGGTMLDATFNSPYMMWKTSEVKTGKGGWLEIPIAPELIQAVAVGLSHGLVMSDEKGQTRENHDVYTREQGNAKPYLIIEGEVLPQFTTTYPAPEPFRAVPYLQAAGFKTGAIRVDTSWPKRAKDVFASRVRVFRNVGKRADLNPPVRQAVTFSEPVVIFDNLTPNGSYLVSVDTYVSGMLLKGSMKVVRASPALTTPIVPKTTPPNLLSLAGISPGWSFLRRYVCEKASADLKGFVVRKPTSFSVPLTPRNAWVGTQVVILPLGGKAENVTVELTELRDARLKALEAFGPLKHVKLYRVWYVPKGKDYHAEVLVPLKSGEKFSIPWAQNKVPNQANQAIFVDVWVPKSARAGPYEGKFVVRRNGKPVMTVPIKVQVAGVTLPDKFNIVGDMNAYSSPARAMGVKNSDPKAFMEMERKYYRLAHSHRMTLNVLPYSQSGSINWRGAPKIAGKGKDCKVIDWSEWDERFGPLLSGEAFTAKHGYLGPGEGIPIHHMYLPFHENWPAKLAEHFKPWPPPKDYQKFLRWTADLPGIKRCFNKDYGNAWYRLADVFDKHLKSEGFNRTRCQVYLNNKYYFRNREKGFGRGISLWLLDEPMFADDFLALAWYGRWTRYVMYDAGGKFNVDFRIDISRPGYQRNWLDGVVDLSVCAGQLYKQRRLIAYHNRKFGEEYWNYKMPPSFTSSNLAWTVWPVRSYCWGANGTLPWQTIASDGDLYKADATALMYPGRKFGLNEPVPSLRMKAWREGIQVAELLHMLKIKMKWNDIQLRAFVGQVCNLNGWKDGLDPEENAPIVTFKGVIPGTLAKLKRATILMLSKKQ
ncbi:MAG: DUF4091 domain-containing protein [Phycisphaerae bacterium]|nr:DUF4091 domain-containing protein [Phycisphaerae bacterium]